MSFWSGRSDFCKDTIRPSLHVSLFLLFSCSSRFIISRGPGTVISTEACQVFRVGVESASAAAAGAAGAATGPGPGPASLSTSPGCRRGLYPHKLNKNRHLGLFFTHPITLSRQEIREKSSKWKKGVSRRCVSSLCRVALTRLGSVYRLLRHNRHIS